VVLSSVERNESPNHTKQLKDVQDSICRVGMPILLWMMNMRMKESTNELASPIFSLNLASKGMPIEEYVQLVGQKFIDAKYNMSELVDLAWGRENHFGLDLNLVLDLKEEPMEGNDLDDQPTPISQTSSSP
jgi:hypothetical protein